MQENRAEVRRQLGWGLVGQVLAGFEATDRETEKPERPAGLAERLAIAKAEASGEREQKSTGT